jgi:hypothetical protein
MFRKIFETIGGICIILAIGAFLVIVLSVNELRPITCKVYDPRKDAMRTTLCLLRPGRIIQRQPRATDTRESFEVWTPSASRPTRTPELPLPYPGPATATTEPIPYP